MGTILTATGSDLRDALARVLPATDRGKLRPILTGVNFARVDDDYVRVAATDSYRLHVAYVRARMKGEPVTVAGLRLPMVPARSGFRTFELVVDDDLHVSIGDANGASVVEGQFPDIDQLRPDWASVTGAPWSWSFLPDETFGDFCRLASRTSDHPVARVVVDDDGAATFTVVTRFGDLSHVERGTLRGEIAGPFGIRPSFLLDACGAVGGAVSLCGKAPTRPIVVLRESGTSGRDVMPWALVMPVRLG